MIVPHDYFPNYRPPTNVWEGNVLSYVCLYTGRSHVTITHDVLDLTIQEPS